MADLDNPFDIVKATDLTSEQIADYFVDFPAGASLLDRVRPRSKMPMFIFGGKGSGKTHLMRYLSSELQLRRAPPGRDGREAVAAEGYLGLYFQCSGLNAQRFSGKGQPDEVWQAVFAYYMELWLSQIVINTVTGLCGDSEDVTRPELLDALTALLDVRPPTRPASLAAFGRYVESLQRGVDVAVNNCALRRRLDVEVQATPGRLIFGVPRELARYVHGLDRVLFLYLVDEFENLTEVQQRYINTLLRERADPCTFKVGVRLYGIRTKQTLSAGEENRENAEYEVLRLDTELRERPPQDQLEFAANLVRKRLAEAGYHAPAGQDAEVGSWFEESEPGRLHREEFAELAARAAQRELPYLGALREKLREGLRSRAAPGLRSPDDVEAVIGNLRVAGLPFVERANVFLAYRAWSKGEPLLEASARIAESARRFVAAEEGSEHEDVLKHFGSDVIAQLVRDARLKQRYLGFDTFVKMSAGLPRGLLTILKYVFTWSSFYGEKPFREGKISAKAQTDAIAQASEWFFTEARAPGVTGARVRDAMTRLGQLLRDIRFSDKPSECSLSTFSGDVTAASQEALAVLRESENWSMLLRVAGGQHDRNESGRVDEKYQVHPMLAPRWDLPIARRGALSLSGDEVSAVFAPADGEQFARVLRRRVDAMNAPFFGRGEVAGSLTLPGLTNG